jgi:hypothetical protein
LSIGSVELGTGRPVVPRRGDDALGPAALWVSDRVVPDVAAAWWTLAQQFEATGLWPLVLQALDESGRPWNSGELMPAAEGDVDALDVRQVLEDGWNGWLVPVNNPWPPGTGPLAPFGPGFPGLAPLQRAASNSRLALARGGRARIGLVSCRRPADAVATIGWMGAIDVTGAAEVSAVLRSWEDRFGAVVVGLSFATITLLVSRPPASDDDALRVAAEVAAFCKDALWQPDEQWPYVPREATLEAMSRSLVREPMWRLWFD